MQPSMFKKTVLLLFFLCAAYCVDATAQQQMQAATRNYKEFRRAVSSLSADAAKQNAGLFTGHPEFGLLYPGAPCNDCYEILDKRTETTKTFTERSNGKGRIWVQSSTDPMHYKNERGQWLTIQPELTPLTEQPGIYTSVSSPWPVVIDTRAGHTSIGQPGQRVFVNRELELIAVHATGEERSLGRADWSRHTAGDDGVYVTDIWPGIDMRITVFRGAAKTDFLLNKPLPEYAVNGLVIRDHLKTDEGLSLFRPDEAELSGPLELRHVSGTKAFSISKALAWDQSGANTSSLSYRIPEGSDSKLDIIIPGRWLNLPEASYPVTIDPFVQSSNAVSIGGSGYTPSCFYPVTSGCAYTNTVPVPGGVTITDIRFTFRFYVDASTTPVAGFTIHKDNCTSSGAGGIWTCTSPYPTVLICGGNSNSVYEDLKSCLSPPQCSPYNLDITLRFKRCYVPSAQTCDTYPATAVDPFVVTIEGYTMDPDSIAAIAAHRTICEGASTQLRVEAKNGVPPFRFLWSPGGETDSVITVKPAARTEYTVSTTDQCGSVVSDTVVINVLPNDHPGFTFSPDSVCPRRTIMVKGNGSGPLSWYSWAAPGSAHPSMNNVREWTTTYSSGGVYDITMYYQSGHCKFPATKQITIPVPVPEIISDGTALLTSVPFAAYQWHLDGVDITGATDREFAPGTWSGIYSVTVRNAAGCSGISAPYTYKLGVRSATDSAAIISIYPNPATDMVYIDAPVAVHITISSMDGKTLWQQAYTDGIHTGILPEGVYLLRITDMNGLPLRTERLIRTR